MKVLIMEAAPKDVLIYEDPTGQAPFTEWLGKLRDKQAVAKIDIRIERVRLGNFGYVEPVGEGVMELKIDFGPGYRVYFGQMGSKVVVLLLGGDKASQRKDIAMAKEYWRDFKERYHEK